MPSIFITSISELNNANYFRTWECFPEGEELVFHERILFLKDLEEPFDIVKLHQYMGPYKSETEDGEPISEWRTSAKIE